MPRNLTVLSLAWVQPCGDCLSHYPQGPILLISILSVTLNTWLAIRSRQVLFSLPCLLYFFFFPLVRKCQPLWVSQRKWMGNLQIPVNTHKLSHDLLLLSNGQSFATPRSLGCWILQPLCQPQKRVLVSQGTCPHHLELGKHTTLQPNREILTLKKKKNHTQGLTCWALAFTG